MGWNFIDPRSRGEPPHWISASERLKIPREAFYENDDLQRTRWKMRSKVIGRNGGTRWLVPWLAEMAREPGSRREGFISLRRARFSPSRWSEIECVCDDTVPPSALAQGRLERLKPALAVFIENHGSMSRTASLALRPVMAAATDGNFDVQSRPLRVRRTTSFLRGNRDADSRRT